MTTNFSLTTRAAAAVMFVVLAAGCAKSTDSSATASTAAPGRTDGSSSAVGSTSTDSSVSADNSIPPDNSESGADSTPALEGTGAESPQPAQKQSPTIPIASLPIGGSQDVDGAHQCGHVSLLRNDLPPGISISVDSIDFKPKGIFDLDGAPCGSAPPCATWAWTTETTDAACTVAVTQLIDSAGSVSLVLTGTVHCPDQSSCDQVRSAFEGSGTQFQFTALTGVVPTNSSSPPAGTDGSSAAGSDSSSSPAVSSSGEPSTSSEASTAGS
jgi:hypothetical protein